MLPTHDRPQFPRCILPLKWVRAVFDADAGRKGELSQGVRYLVSRTCLSLGSIARGAFSPARSISNLVCPPVMPRRPLTARSRSTKSPSARPFSGRPGASAGTAPAGVSHGCLSCVIPVSRLVAVLLREPLNCEIVISQYMYSKAVTQRYPLQVLQCNQDHSLLVPPAHEPLPSALARQCRPPAKQRILPVAAEGCILRQGRSRHCLAGQLAARRAPGNKQRDTVRSVAGKEDDYLYTGLLHQASRVAMQPAATPEVRANGSQPARRLCRSNHCLEDDLLRDLPCSSKPYPRLCLHRASWVAGGQLQADPKLHFGIKIDEGEGQGAICSRSRQGREGREEESAA